MLLNIPSFFMDNKKNISIVIPVYNESHSIEKLFFQIKDNVDSKYNYEIIFVNDGSTDDSKLKILDLVNSNSKIKLIDFYKNRGKSIALNEGFKMSKGDIVITLDADLQDDPNEIDNFIDKLEQGYGLVSGWKKNRKDPISKRFPSKIFNFILRCISGIKIHDFNCGFKAFTKDAVKTIEIYGGLHRFLPIILKANGFAVAEVVVNHRMREFGISKYSGSRIFHGFFDFITLLFFNKYLTRPLHFFGIIGLLLLLFGLSINMYLTINWFNGIWITPYKNPLFFLGLLLIIIGVQFFSIGLIGELIVKLTRNNDNVNCKYYNFDE